MSEKTPKGAKAVVKERPILMNGEMVRAILAGRKTQTRRPLAADLNARVRFVGGRGEEDDLSCWGWDFDGPDHYGWMVLARGLNERHNHGCISIPCPLGESGDRLWIRESFYEGGCAACEVDAATFSTSASTGHDCHSPRCCSYRADVAEEQISAVRWTPSIHMPRWASRLTLEVTDVRVERVTDISEADAMAEGAHMVPFVPDDGFPVSQGWMFGENDGKCTLYPSAKDAFAVLWESIYGNWKSRPWVWAVTFKRLEVSDG